METAEQKQDKFEYITIPVKVLRDKRLKGRSRELWGYLNFRCFEKGYCWYSYDQIEDDLSMSRPTISSYSKLLSKLGYITVKVNGGWYGTNLYKVHDLKDVKIPPHKSKVKSRKEARVKKTLEKITSQLNQGITYVDSKDLLLIADSVVMVVIDSVDVVKTLSHLGESLFTKPSKDSLLRLVKPLNRKIKTQNKAKNKAKNKEALKTSSSYPPENPKSTQVEEEESKPLRGLSEEEDTFQQEPDPKTQEVYNPSTKGKGFTGKGEHKPKDDSQDPLSGWPLDVPHICPECEKRVVQRTSEFGIFFGCSGYPKCTWKYKPRKLPRHIQAIREEEFHKDWLDQLPDD